VDDDMARFKKWAGPHTVTGTFSGDIYPPGFDGADSFSSPTDKYKVPLTPGHTTLNAHHIYYYDGDMKIEGTVHGQVLFVATGNIYISSSLVVSTDLGDMPGAGFASSSTAHQAVLITRGNVYIQSNLQIPPTGTITEYIQALILAPNGKFIPQNYTDLFSHPRLALDFEGALILSTMKNSPDPALTSVFQAGRTYRYMDSLRTNPPPYLPYVVDIYYSLEDSRGSDRHL
jgi:hypothetical protein